MKFKLWREHGALNSPPIFAAVEQGLKKIGMTVVDRDQDIDVIWSVLWQGRMMPNKIIYEKAKSLNKPIMIIEVGNLLRGSTWRISLDHIHGLGTFANSNNLDIHRPKKLGIALKNVKNSRKDSILIACQHANSLQWASQPTIGHWVYKTVEEVRQYSDRPIIVRPHPRSPISIKLPGVEVITPAKVPNTYDDFNISYDHHCVINYNSGPAVKAAIEGTPVICDQTSLAWPVSDKIENLDKISLPDREDWFLKLCHTEWTVPELQNGEPFSRLFLK
jgi:hypothetical protein